MSPRECEDLRLRAIRLVEIVPIATSGETQHPAEQFGIEPRRDMERRILRHIMRSALPIMPGIASGAL